MNISNRVSKGIIDTARKNNEKNRLFTAMVAASVVAAVGPEVEEKEADALSLPDIQDMNADQQAYYLALALRDLQTVIDAANFNLDDIIEVGKPSISNMFFSRDGAADVDAIIPLDIEPQEDYSGIPQAFKLKQREEFKSLVSYSLNLPTAAKPTASVSLNLHLPASLVTSVGADKFDTRAKELQKYIEGMFKANLG